MRDGKIDFIRAVCSLLVILAHVSAPEWINEIRTFDVVCLVLISGMSLIHSSNTQYGKYVWKRIEKLLFPTYFMMLFIFLGSYVACSILRVNQLYSRSTVIHSFLLLNEGSMGYVWIVRIYLIIAVLSPVISVLSDKTNSFGSYIAVNALCVLFAFFILKIVSSIISNSTLRVIIIDWIYGGFVYSVIAFDGLWLIKNKKDIKKTMFLVSGVFCFLSIVLSLKNDTLFFAPGHFKFPPRLYYCVYGLLVGIALYILAPNTKLNAVKWVSINSFKIYLWHIVFLHVYGMMTKFSFLSFLDEFWLIKYIIVISCSIIVTLVFEKLIKTVKGRRDAKTKAAGS